ncbi:hypothetical protein [Ruminococcus sp.]|uniref:hypothetical protein n=1 Tax=Ruminococcus sp. TaxID=41978 RepID=UPI003F0D9350
MYTEQMEDKLFQQWDEFDEYDEDYSELIEMLNSEDSFRTFGDGLLFFLKKREPDLTAETAVKYIEKLCNETDVSKNDIASANTLKSWFKGGPRPKKGEDSRESMFALAFALQLTPDETAELFHKVYLDRAFDYRNKKEIIYYFCLYNKKSWRDANRLLESAENIAANKDDYTIYTSQIKSDVEAMTDETALLAYIAKHGHNLEKKNTAAKQTMGKLLSKAKETAKDEAELPEYAGYFNGSDRDSLNFTYEVITNLSVSGDKGTKTLFKNARLPKEIKNRFPEATTLSKKDPTYEELRKLIILLFSYDYWFKIQKENKVIEIDDYIGEMNVYLDQSGFSLMYYGNPYDWMFLYCALSKRPLDTFRGLLAEVLNYE